MKGLVRCARLSVRFKVKWAKNRGGEGGNKSDGCNSNGKDSTSDNSDDGASNGDGG